MWEFTEFCFFTTIVWTVGIIYHDLKRVNEKVDGLIQATTRGTGPLSKNYAATD